MDVTQAKELKEARIPGHDVFYFPNFVTVEEEEFLIRKIVDSPQSRWKTLSNRRLQVWGGEISSTGILFPQPLPSFVTGFPDVLSRITRTGVFRESPHKSPNHIIMNEYLSGQGIMPHEDGPQYHPVVATLSLGSHAVFHYYQYVSEAGSCGDDLQAGGRSIDRAPVLSVLLEPRSLIISSGAMYQSHLHGIDPVTEDTVAINDKVSGIRIANLDRLGEETRESIHKGEALKRGARYSLTCRDVERVSRLNTTFHR